MNFQIGKEALLLLYSLTVGACLGVLFDVFRIVRIALFGRKKRPESYHIRLPSTEKEADKAMRLPYYRPSVRDVPLFFSDLLFCTVSAVAVILLLFQLSDGKIRGFALIGALIGFSVYFFTIGKLVIFFSEKIISGIKKAVFFLLSHTVLPILRLFMRLFRKISAKLRRAGAKRRTARIKKQILADAGAGFGYYDKNKGIKNEKHRFANHHRNSKKTVS